MGIELIGKIKPKNNGEFALVDAHDIEVNEQGTRLDEALAGKLSLSGGVLTGEIKIGQGDGKGIQLGDNGRLNGTIYNSDGTLLTNTGTILGLDNGKSVFFGHTGVALNLRGSKDRPTYYANDTTKELALLSDIDGKVDKLTKSTGNYFVYTHFPGGEDSYIIAPRYRTGRNPSYYKNSLQQHGENGEYTVGTPADPYDATPKYWVEDQLDGKVDKIDKTGGFYLYMIDTAGQVVAKNIANTVQNIANWSIPWYFGGNNDTLDQETTFSLATGTPQKPYAAANKLYVDTEIAKVSGGGGGSVIVDSELSTTSTNPVQNKVVKEAVDGKLDKYTVTNQAGNAVYVAHANGTQTTVWLSPSPQTNHVVRYTDRATVQTKTPTQNLDAANKEYVDGQLDNKLDKITTTADYPRVYAIRINGEQTTYRIDDGGCINYVLATYMPNTMGDEEPYSANKAILLTNTPTKPYQAANKKYVDDAIAAGGGGSAALPEGIEMLSGGVINLKGERRTTHLSVEDPDSQEYVKLYPGAIYFSGSEGAANYYAHLIKTSTTYLYLDENTAEDEGKVIATRDWVRNNAGGGGGIGAINFTDNGEGDVTITASGGTLNFTDDGNGNITLGVA